MQFISSCLRPWTLLVLVSLGLILSACGGSGDSSSAGNSGGGTPITGLSINTSAINFSATQNGALPATQFFTITWTGSNVAGVLIGVPAGTTVPSWLSLSAPGTTTISPVTLNVAVTATNLDPGNYSTTIRIIPRDINGNSLGLIDIPLTYVVNSTVTNITGLDFPSNPTSNMQSGPYVAFQWTNPQNIGLPAWGPLIPNTTRGAGVTYIWKYKPRQQAGYYVTLWWASNDGVFYPSKVYYGAHPYPVGSGNTTLNHYWELAGMESGADFVITNSGSPKTVVKDVWYTQALQIIDNGNDTRTATFYINLPSTAPEDIITHTSNSSFSEIPASPALIFGDSPWYAGYQHERLSGILRGIKIFNKGLSQIDILSEAANDNLVTSEGIANVWYMNINPTPDDISDKSGKNHHPAWVQSQRATLWVP